MNDKQKYLLGGIVLVLVIVGLGALHYMKFKERGKLQTQIEKYGRQSRDAQEKIKRIPELRAEREKLVDSIGEYMKILPKEEHVQHDAFVEIIDQYRSDTEIDILDAEYVVLKEKAARRRSRGAAANAASGEEEKDFIRHRYKFKLLGTVPELVQFMNKIENHTRFLKVDALKIRPQGSTTDIDSGASLDQQEEELELASNPVKEIELTVSTYTYFKSSEKNQKS